MANDKCEKERREYEEARRDYNRLEQEIIEGGPTTPLDPAKTPEASGSGAELIAAKRRMEEAKKALDGCEGKS